MVTLLETIETLTVVASDLRAHGLDQGDLDRLEEKVSQVRDFLEDLVGLPQEDE